VSTQLEARVKSAKSSCLDLDVKLKEFTLPNLTYIVPYIVIGCVCKKIIPIFVFKTHTYLEGKTCFILTDREVVTILASV
jgi:hypothetical protein